MRHRGFWENLKGLLAIDEINRYSLARSRISISKRFCEVPMPANIPLPIASCSASLPWLLSSRKEEHKMLPQAHLHLNPQRGPHLRPSNSPFRPHQKEIISG